MTISTSAFFGPGAAPNACEDMHPERLGIMPAVPVSGEAHATLSPRFVVSGAGETIAPSAPAERSPGRSITRCDDMDEYGAVARAFVPHPGGAVVMVESPLSATTVVGAEASCAPAATKIDPSARLQSELADVSTRIGQCLQLVDTCEGVETRIRALRSTFDRVLQDVRPPAGPKKLSLPNFGADKEKPISFCGGGSNSEGIDK